MSMPLAAASVLINLQDSKRLEHISYRKICQNLVISFLITLHFTSHTQADSQLNLSSFEFLQRLLSVSRRESGGEFSGMNSTEELH